MCGSGDIRARVLEGPLLSPRVSKSRVSELTGARPGQRVPPMPGHREERAGLMEGLCFQNTNESEKDRGRERDRERKEDPVPAAASLQPTAWLRWKR